MSDVIDIIHRLTYETDPTGVNAMTQSIQKQIQETERLTKEAKELAKEFSRTADTDIAKREEIIKKINANKKAIKELDDSIHGTVITNKELLNVLQKEQGIIGSLNTQLDILKKKRDAATDPKAIQEYNRQIAAINQQVATTTKNQGPKGGNTASAGIALSNIVRDAPYGVIGVANNVTQLTDALAILRQQTGSTSGALKALFSSLAGPAGLALGISIITSLLTVLVQKYGSLSNAIGELFGTITLAERAQRGLAESMKEGAKEAEKAATTVGRLRNEIQLAKDGFISKDQVVKEYNDTIGKTTGAVKTLEEAEKELQKNAEAYIRFTLLKAAANNAQEESSKRLLKAELDSRKKLDEFSSMPGLNRKGLLSVLTTDIDDVKEIKRQGEELQKERKAALIKQSKDEQKVYDDIASDLFRQAAIIAQKFGFNFEKQGPTKEIENVYQQKLLELKARLAELTASTFKSGDIITQKVAAEVAKGRDEIDRLFKDKKLTAPQRDILKAFVGNIGDAQLKKEMEDYQKIILNTRQKMDDALNNLVLENNDKRTQLIRDDFERQGKALEDDLFRQQEALAKAQREMLEDNENKRKAGHLADNPILNDKTAKENADRIKLVYKDLLDTVQLIFNQRKVDLSFSLFNREQLENEKQFAQDTLEFTQRATAEVQKLTDAYVKGTISYENYQKGLTKIFDRESNTRLNQDIQKLVAEQRLLERRLQTAKDNNLPKADIDALEKRLLDIKTQISVLNRQMDQNTGTKTKKTRDEQNEALKRRIDLYKTLSDAGIQAAQAIAAAEEDRVNREIAAQERRVERATALAERGNAKILQSEEERLARLQQEQEKYARQQAGYNALQTASASVLAIANAAASGDGYSAAFRVAAVLAALAAGFAAVKSLATDAAGYRDGVIDLQGPGTKTSDSIPARLSRGESVMTADATAANKELLEAMNEGRKFQLLDLNMVAQLSRRYADPIMPSGNLQGLVIMQPAAAQESKQTLRRLEAIEKAIVSKPTQSWFMDRRGFVAMAQDEIRFQDNLKRL